VRSAVNVRFDKDEWRRIELQLGGLTALGALPDPEVFPLTTNERVFGGDADQLRAQVGGRIVHRLCGGDYHTREFLVVALEWVQSVQRECYARDIEWWVNVGATPGVAGDMAATMRQNGDRLEEVVELLEHAVDLTEALEVVR